MRVVCVNQDPGIAPGRAKGASVHLRAMREAFEELGARVVRVDQSEGVEERLEELWSEGELDLLYERYALSMPAAARFALRRAIPRVLEVNSPLAEEAERWRGYSETPGSRRRDREVFATATAVVAVSSPVAEYSVSRGASADRVEVFRNGVDTRIFRPRLGTAASADLVPEGRFVIGFHGRLRPWHGFERLIEAGSRLIGAGLPVQLLTVGRGEFAETLRGTALAEHSTILDWQPYERVAELVAMFDALPLMYGADQPFYFSPLKLAEAMACGAVPVVPSLGELASTIGPAGLVYTPGSVDELTDSLAGLVGDRDERRRLGRLAVVRSRRYSWRRIAEFALAQVPSSKERPCHAGGAA